MTKEDFIQIRKPLYFILACMLCISFCLFCEITAHAEESERPYIYDIVIERDDYIVSHYVESEVPIIWSYQTAGSLHYYLFEDGVYTYTQRKTDKETGKVSESVQWKDRDAVTGKYYLMNSYMNADNIVSVTDNVVIVKNTDEEVYKYLRGELDTLNVYVGVLGSSGKLPVDYSSPHNFAQDTYDPSIPLPELSNINHNGFTLTNKGNYWYDVIVESKLNGVAIGTTSGSNNVVNGVIGGLGGVGSVTNTTALGVLGGVVSVDTYIGIDKSWIYNSHYYNFTLAHVASSETVFDMSALYGQDNAAALLEDFKAWSLEYPAYNTLPSYSWVKMSTELKNHYNNWYVYNSESTNNFMNNGMAETTFYVRFYEFGDMNYGQWVKYTFRSGSDETIHSTVTSRPIEVTPGGNVVEGTGLTGSVDSSGNISYVGSQPEADTSTSGALSNMMTGLDEFMSLMDIFKSFVGDLPELVSYLFTFFPWWLNAMLIAAVVLAIILRVLGR